MLELRPNCECCDKDLPPDSGEARICSFECTFCSACAEGVLHGKCPNCGGELLVRPRRPFNKLANNPPVTTRTLKPQGCAEAVARKPAVRSGQAGARLARLLAALPTALLASLLVLAAGSVLAANPVAINTPAAKTQPTPQAKLVQPSPTGKGKTERPAVTKLRAKTITPPVPKPGKTVVGSRPTHARTIVTKRILPP
jgi:hypothetical protein